MTRSFLLALALSTTARCLSAESDIDQLTKAKSLKCEFTRAVYAEWKNGNPMVHSDQKDNLTLHFDSIDTKQGTARVIGNQAATDVSAILTPQSLSFFETTPSGNVILTTIFAFKKNNAFAAVSSRHVDIGPGGPIPSQSYGACKLWE